MTPVTADHRVVELESASQPDYPLGSSSQSMQWLKRIGLAGVVFFTVKGLIWLGAALIALVVMGG